VVDHRSVGRRCALKVARFSGAQRDAHRRTALLACPRFFLALPRARAAFPLALCDLRPVTAPTSSSTRPARRSTAPSVLLRRALLNTVCRPVALPTPPAWARSAIHRRDGRHGSAIPGPAASDARVRYADSQDQHLDLSSATSPEAAYGISHLSATLPSRNTSAPAAPTRGADPQSRPELDQPRAAKSTSPADGTLGDPVASDHPYPDSSQSALFAVRRRRP
jgi:hypothetical protein